MGAGESGRLTVIFSNGDRNGTTLLTRCFVDYLRVLKRKFNLYDLDEPQEGISHWFGTDATMINLRLTSDQMRLFDSILSQPRAEHVIDLPAARMETFFQVVKEINFLQECRNANIDVVYFYTVEDSAASLQKLRDLRHGNRSDWMITVRNLDVGDVLLNLRIAADYVAMAKDGEVVMPRLSDATMQYINEDDFSFFRFLTRDSATFPPEIQVELCDFIEPIFSGFNTLQFKIDMADLKRRGIA